MIELLHTFGLCLLVFRVLPLFDMMRGFIVVGSIYTVPAILKAIFEGIDKSLGCQRKFILSILNICVVVIQLGSILGCCIFGISMTKEDKLSLQNVGTNHTTLGAISRPPVINQPRGLWEIPVALICISLSYWENFVDGDLSVFGCTIRIHSWKKYLDHCRPRIYLIASVWKIILVVGFAKILQPDFIFNMTFSIPFNTTNKFSSDINDDSVSVVFQERKGDQTFSNTSANTEEHFEMYGILYIQVIASIVLTCCASMACKLSMQIIGFSLPLILSTPVSATIVVLQCIYQCFPTGVFICVCPDEDADLWHLVWLVQLWLSKLFLVSYIWFPKHCRMEKTDRYFFLISLFEIANKKTSAHPAGRHVDTTTFSTCMFIFTLK